METNVISMQINGVEYVRADSISTTSIPKGNRAVVVVDRGWIYAGDLEQKDGRIVLHNAVWVFNWQDIGFSEVIRNPRNKKVDLRKMEYPVDIPIHAEVYRIPVPSDWGL